MSMSNDSINIADFMSMSDDDFVQQMDSLDNKITKSEQADQANEEDHKQEEDVSSLGSQEEEVEEEETKEEESSNESNDSTNDLDDDEDDSSEESDEQSETESEEPDAESEKNEEEADPVSKREGEKKRKTLSVKRTKDQKESEDDSKDGKVKDKSKVSDTGEEGDKPDYEALYNQIMQPFKANGKMIELGSPEEVIKLMQMGANYTKKMQSIQPNLKIIRMLENHELLDEGKLSQLIDISKGNKNALAKFASDKGIDLLDIDTDEADKYEPSNHTVSDREIRFETIVDNLVSTEPGQELITHIHQQWDQASKDTIFEEPDLVNVLAQHKIDGIYDQITAEVEKQRVLGHPQIASLPFIQAYRTVGEQLSQAGKLKPKSASTSNQQQPSVQSETNTPQEIGRSTPPVRKSVKNDAKAKAASPSGRTSKKATPKVDIMAMSDEEFLKYMENTV